MDILKDERVPIVDRIWVGIRALPNDKQQRLFAIWCAERAMETIPESRRDARSLNCIEVAKKYVNGEATQAELLSARKEAWNAATAAAAYAAATATATAAAYAAADDAATAAAYAAAATAADDATAAAATAADDAATAARQAMREKELARLIELHQ